MPRITLALLSRTVCFGLPTLFVCPTALAQESKPQAPAPPKESSPERAEQPADSSPLGGPKVATPAKAVTLVQRDMAGKLERLDRAPAEAVLPLLTIDDKQKPEIDRILTQRAAALDGIVRDNIKLLAELAGARAAGTQSAEYRNMLRQLWEVSDPLRQRGTLGQELAPHLTAEQNATLRRLTTEYMQAVITEETAAAKEAGEEKRPNQILMAETLRIVGDEVKRSYDRVVGQQARDFDALLRELNVAPEQESRIRQVVGDSFQKTYGKATDAEKSRVFMAVWKELTPEQRTLLIEKIRSAPGNPKAPKDSEKPAGTEKPR